MTFQIAVLDDEPSITKLLSLVLKENFDCEVEQFNDPLRAQERFGEKKFDVITTDHRMPGLTGVGLVKAIRASQGPNKSTNILMLTGYREMAASDAIEAGLTLEKLENVVILEKPLKEESLVTWVKILLKGKESKKSL